MNGLAAPFRFGVPIAVAGTAMLFLFGCGTVGEGDGGGYTEVYGDYGYDGPWPYNTFEADGYIHTRPPYDHWDGGHPGGPGHPEPGRGPEPGHGPGPGHGPEPGHNNPRPPSIPNQPRPSGGGGGGGGHPSGGGGGGARGGGGGRK